MLSPRLGLNLRPSLSQHHIPHNTGAASHSARAQTALGHHNGISYGTIEDIIANIAQ
jgi:hypothetical protein